MKKTINLSLNFVVIFLILLTIPGIKVHAAIADNMHCSYEYEGPLPTHLVTKLSNENFETNTSLQFDFEKNGNYYQITSDSEKQYYIGYGNKVNENGIIEGNIEAKCPELSVLYYCEKFDGDACDKDYAITIYHFDYSSNAEFYTNNANNMLYSEGNNSYYEFGKKEWNITINKYNNGEKDVTDTEGNNKKQCDPTYINVEKVNNDFNPSIRGLLCSAYYNCTNGNCTSTSKSNYDSVVSGALCSEERYKEWYEKYCDGKKLKEESTSNDEDVEGDEYDDVSIRTETTYTGENSGKQFKIITILTFATNDIDVSNEEKIPPIRGIGDWYLIRKVYVYTSKGNIPEVYLCKDNSSACQKLMSDSTDKFIGEDVLLYQYSKKVSRNLDLPKEFYVLNRGDTARNKVYIYIYPTNTVADLEKYKKTDTETTQKISGRTKIRCDYKESYVTFAASAENGKPDLYVRETGALGNLDLSIALSGTDLSSLFSVGNVAALQMSRINITKDTAVKLLTIALSGVTLYGIFAPALGAVAGTSVLAAKVVNAVAGVAKFAIKTSVAATIGGAAFEDAFKQYTVRIVDCGTSVNRTCGKLSEIFSMSTSDFEGSSCRVMKDDESSKWENQDVSEMNCTALTDTKFWDIMQYILKLLRTVACIALIVFGAIDFTKSVMSGDADSLKKSGTTFVKRLILTVFIFFVPAIINLLFTITGLNQCN